jgi:hypothetical protein
MVVLDLLVIIDHLTLSTYIATSQILVFTVANTKSTT